MPRALVLAIILVLLPVAARAACPAAPTTSTTDALVRFKSPAAYAQVIGAGTPGQGDLVYDTTNNVLKLCDGTSWTALTTGNPAGSSGQIQFNSAGSFGAASTFVWDNANGRMGIGTTAPQQVLQVSSPYSVTLNTGLLLHKPVDISGNGTGIAFSAVNNAVASPAGALVFTLNDLWTIRGNFDFLSDQGNDGFTLTDSVVRITYDGKVGIGTRAPTSVLQLAGAVAATSWSTTGIGFSVLAATYTDTSTAAAGTVTTRAASSFAVPTLASTNAITVTNAATLYVAGAPTAGTNTTITNAYALYVAAGVSYFGANILQAASAYHNFGTTAGSGGYGVRDNAGTLEYKNSGGSWTAFTSASQFAAGSAGSPGLYATGDTNTGLYQATADTLAVTAGGVEVARFNTAASAVNYLGITPAAMTAAVQIATAGSDSNIGLAIMPKGTGNVGVGTTSPQERLDVSGDYGRIRGAGTVVTGLKVNNTDGSDRTWTLGALGNAALSNGFGPNKGFSLYDNGASAARLVVNTAGEVGIGTTNPSTTLDLRGASTTKLGVGLASAHDAVIEVGAGATGNHYAYIDLTGDATYTDYGLRIMRDNTGENAVSQLVHNGTGMLRLFASGAAPIVLTNAGTERLRVASSGHIGIGTGATLATSLGGTMPVLQIVEGTSVAQAWLRTTNDAHGAHVTLQKTRGTDATTLTTVQTNDGIGEFTWMAADGTGWVPAARISSYVDAAPSTGVVPAALVFHTATSGTLVSRMVIASGGSVGIGTATPRTTLDVNGYARLAKYAAQPAACSATNDGALALTSGYTLCACKGGTTSWVKVVDGTTACAW